MEIELYRACQLIVAKKVGKKNWKEIDRDFLYGLGVSKVYDYESLMIQVFDVYLKFIIPKRQLILLRKSIHSADITGEDIVLKDLALQIDNILQHFKIKHKTKYVKLK